MENDTRPHGNRAAIVAGAALLLALVVAAGVILTRTDDADVSPETIPPPASPEATPSPAETVEEPVEVAASEQELWFVQEERLSWGTTVVGGTLPSPLNTDDRVAQKAAFWLGLLLTGPTAPDEELGATTAIPRATQLLGVERDGSVLRVDLSSEFGSGGGSLSMQLRVAQVVYTATQFEGIDRARILIDGEEVDAVGGEGVIVSEPLGRRDFQNVAPPIVVEDPAPGAELSSGGAVSGFANVFEANVSIRLLDSNGNVLVETFTTATCGSGCWGDFEHDIEFDVTDQQEGRLEVLTYSAEDGSPQDIISLPVVLVP